MFVTALFATIAGAADPYEAALVEIHKSFLSGRHATRYSNAWKAFDKSGSNLDGFKAGGVTFFWDHYSEFGQMRDLPSQGFRPYGQALRKAAEPPATNPWARALYAWVVLRNGEPGLPKDSRLPPREAGSLGWKTPSKAKEQRVLQLLKEVRQVDDDNLLADAVEALLRLAKEEKPSEGTLALASDVAERSENTPWELDLHLSIMGGSRRRDGKAASVLTSAARDAFAKYQGTSYGRIWAGLESWWKS